MPNLKSLKVRINSVKSTQKITKAMKMVSASKLRRAREAAEAALPYSEKMNRMVSTLAANANKASAPPLLTGTGSDKKHLLVVITSDRGLCGGLNTSIFKQVKHQIESLESQGKQVKLFCIGKKGVDLFHNAFGSYVVHKIEGISKQKRINWDDANNQVQHIIDLFDKGEFDVCSIFYNKFKSAIEQQVTQQQVIPLEVGDVAEASCAPYDYEPGENEILSDLLPRNLTVQLFHALLENAASEQGARMTAMDNATRNAGEMIKKLTLQYNRTRQAAITSELIEIISGAEAV